MKQSAITIVPMRHAHLGACEAIVAASDPWKRLNEHIDFWKLLAANRTGAKAYVSRMENRTTGFVVFIPEPVFARGGYLRALGVAAGFRGRGIGKKLLAFAEDRTAERAVHFFLCVSSFNRAGRAFYKKCGYAKAGTLPDFILPGVSEHIFWKRLQKKK